MAERFTERNAARQIVKRAVLPTTNLLEEVGEMMLLTGRTVSSALRPPFPYGEEFVSQFLLLNLVLVTLIEMLRTQIFWGTNPRVPIGG
jgi:hypothetical protein